MCPPFFGPSAVLGVRIVFRLIDIKASRRDLNVPGAAVAFSTAEFVPPFVVVPADELLMMPDLMRDLMPVKTVGVPRCHDDSRATAHVPPDFRRRVMNLKMTLYASVLILAVGACATQTKYEDDREGYGYADEALGNGRYRVSFHGNSETPQSRVENLLLLRMADLAMIEGATRFTVEARKTDCLSTIRTDPHTACTYRESTAAMFPYVLIDYDKSRFWRARPTKEYEAVAVMRLGGDDPCEEARDCYDAVAVNARLDGLRG